MNRQRQYKQKRRSNGPVLFVFLVLGLVYYISQTESFNIDWGSPTHLFKEDEPKHVTELHPEVAAKKSQLVELAKQKGIQIMITEGHRSEERQNELYEQGRTTEGQIVTSARGGESYHNYGLAIDFAIRVSEDKVIWDMEYDGNNNGESDWMEVVSIAKNLGFEWGGDWVNFPDYPHLQYDFGYSIAELQRGKRPPGYEIEPEDLEASE